MRSEVAKRILARTKPETHQHVRKYGELVNRIHQLLQEKEWTKKDLATALDKSPSEISKWLNGEHNLTWKSIMKLETELGADLIYIPRQVEVRSEPKIQMTVVSKNEPVAKETDFKLVYHSAYKEKIG